MHACESDSACACLRRVCIFRSSCELVLHWLSVYVIEAEIREKEEEEVVVNERLKGRGRVRLCICMWRSLCLQRALASIFCLRHALVFFHSLNSSFAPQAQFLSSH